MPAPWPGPGPGGTSGVGDPPQRESPVPARWGGNEWTTAMSAAFRTDCSCWVEIRDGAVGQGNRLALSGAGGQNQLVRDEVKLQREHAPLVRDAAGGEAAGRDVERDVPGVVDPGSVTQADFCQPSASRGGWWPGCFGCRGSGG